MKDKIIEILKKHIGGQDLSRNRYNLLNGEKAFENIADEILQSLQGEQESQQRYQILYQDKPTTDEKNSNS